MSSLAERLRDRSGKRPAYTIDDSDDDGDFVPRNPISAQDKMEKIERHDAKENSCQACCEGDGNLLSCATCNYSYHPKCLLQRLKAPFPTDWSCPACVSPLTNIEKILDFQMRPTTASDADASEMGSEPTIVKQYLVKWKGLSYLHCTWVHEEEFLKAFKSNPRLRTRVNNFHKQMGTNNDSEEEHVAVQPEWTTVDRVIACRGQDDEKEYFVKWKELPYDECYWESESDISVFQSEIEKFLTIQSGFHRHSVAKQKISLTDPSDYREKEKEFQHYERSPEFLSGGSLHPYQLEGLNFLRFSWSKRTHVILADEMGLGKTIQSIAFLASVFEDGLYPHLVVAPLSTLRNWEREFATWAPHMNVVMYVGSAKARGIIKEHEFFYATSNVKGKRSAGQGAGHSKQGKVKFDVLLTSYEMINLDTASLKAIKWQCMIVDEGHRLKNKQSKLFSSLKQFPTRHRVLLTGTPLQNNLDELFMLMHFLDAGKFGSLEDFREEFKDINREEQISRLHKMLAPHLLRRVKKDVMKELPPKKELILRVDLSSKQKQYYKAILTRNYEQLTRQGKAQVSLVNVLMELRKLCCHPYMIESVEPRMGDTNEYFRQLLETSGKMQLLDKMMVKLKEQGHRVLIFSQFQKMLKLLEDYLSYKKWSYERIDGKVGGAERQVRIDRFNAENSSRFCFLLSTRAGGLGINLATADTIIIYDSDWNPHADLQAMGRAHRLGQTNKVLIYRLVTRGTVEEHIVQMTKKKMVLEHLVVGKLKGTKINQEELDDIIKHGSKELFADDKDAAAQSRQIHYDEAAIDKLLDRDAADPEEKGADEGGDDSFLQTFKVANFGESDRAAEGSSSTPSNTDRTEHWVELLKDRYEEHKIEESSALGKRRRSRRQVIRIGAEEDPAAGPAGDSSDTQDENYEAELSDEEAAPSGPQGGKRPPRRRARGQRVQPQPHPLMEGEGRSLRVLGFNQRQRAAFLRIMMRFGVGEYDWRDFVPRLRPKTLEEITDYGMLFLTHVAEDVTDSPTFSDGVPKEGLVVPDVLVRLGTLMTIRDKVKWASENPEAPFFTPEIMSRYRELLGGRFWTQEHDKMLLHAVLRHGYGRWQAIVNDRELKILEVINLELNFPPVNLPAVGQPSTSSISDPSTVLSLGRSSWSTPAASNYGGPGTSSGTAGNPGQQVSRDSTMHRGQVEFVKRRLLVLEKLLTVECPEVHF